MKYNFKINILNLFNVNLPEPKTKNLINIVKFYNRDGTTTNEHARFWRFNEI